ncbi:EmrB/QacA subfamily drug resistance transporter [Jatrophihabitans sp. GAS493]|nr:EmrB/QacA subfamily drug resistance transporter [Jatrophihabitans sp. GAS493]
MGFRSERGPILIALMLATSLVAIDSTIIATAVPSIVRSIGGFTEFPWLFSIYLLAQAVTVPVYSKLADLFGRRPLILFGIALFLLGSIMCGIAWDMKVLIAFRVVQGLGAGAVQPMSITIVGDLYSLQERAKVQGYIASVWGISAVIGPALGGVFSEYVSWRWIFFINIPLCLLAATMLVRNFKEKVVRGRPHIDYLGAVFLTSGCTLLILGVLEGGQAWAWISAPGISILGVGAILIVCFVLVERRVPEPVLPLWVFSRRLLLTSSLVSAAVGGIVLGLTSFLPTYVQDVLGTGPVVAGFALATLTLGWPLAASQSGRLYLRIGFRQTALIGASGVVAGCLLLLLLDDTSSVLQVGLTCFLIGLGMGLTASPTLIAAQSSVGWSQRGVVTGNNLFCRSLGSALAVAAFGAVANATLGSAIVSAPVAGAAPGSGSSGLLTLATHHVFQGVVLLAVAMTIAVAFMPRRTVEVIDANIDANIDAAADAPPASEPSAHS